MTKIAVVALGGNALTRAGQSGSYDEMMANAAAMATAVNDVLDAGWRVVVVHGNGPQVGNLAMQQEAALQQAATAAVPAQQHLGPQQHGVQRRAQVVGDDRVEVEAS